MAPMAKAMGACLNVEDFARVARKRLPRPIVDFFDGAAEDEQTMARNRAAFADWSLLPRAMQDVSRVSANSRVLGQDIAWPFIVAPTGMPGLLHPDGEIGIARAAEKVGALYSLSTMASRSIEEVAAATSGPKAFQLYLFRDRGITLELLQRAKAAGYGALILTVDVQVPANRERDRRSGMLIPPKFGLKTVFDFALCPRWCWNVLVRRPVTLANFTGERADPGVPLLSFINQQFDPSIGWADLEWVAQQWGGPLAIKGVLAADDAERAVEHGASAVILSNHGGRQLDAAVSPMDMLPSVVERLGARAEIIVDGGVRRGTDMLKAIALGAKACMAGRIGLYGLGAGGAAGAAAVLGALRAEFDRDMALLGVTEVAQIDRSRVRPTGRSAMA
ncbi:alpha-hydroxy acid oxidase [Sphingobium sp.]|uniref:alpha-hydroxy acid oxidase n=1 Tax=Sphingobium sp. TaxID=1912891 RepID=UPI0028BD5828|nr:alpha-hydroxy acid oxidase [Sphingobium sp.]